MARSPHRPVPFPAVLAAAACVALIASAASAPAADSGPAIPAPPPPGPSTDRVGFPRDYARRFELLRRVVRREDGRIITVYGNAAAAAVTDAQRLPYPYGSVLVMESTSLAKDSDGRLLLDARGEPRPDGVTGLHVMRREKGFGEAYATNRTGEWEYVEYRPDGSFLTPPEKSGTCAACHLKAGASKDFVYQARLGAAGK